MNYKVYLSTKINPLKVKKGSGIIVLEPDEYSSTQIKALKLKGYKVLAYLSVGTIEKERTFYKKYKKYALKKLEDWPNENYADMTEKVWRNFVISRAKTLIRKKGFDGLWCDNLDCYEYNKNISGYFAACWSCLKAIKALGGYVMVNGGHDFWIRAIREGRNIKDVVSGVTQEEVFSRVTDYKGKGKFAKQHSEDSKEYKSMLKKLHDRGIQTFMLEYSRDLSLKADIKKYAGVKENGITGYYISEDVDL